MSSFIEYDVLFIINIFSKIELINIPNANKIASINVFLVLTKIFVHSINTLKKNGKIKCKINSRSDTIIRIVNNNK